MVIQLCLRNSDRLANRAPTVKEWREVSESEGRRLLTEKLPNGYFWRKEPIAAGWTVSDGYASPPEVDNYDAGE